MQYRPLFVKGINHLLSQQENKNLVNVSQKGRADCVLILFIHVTKVMINLNDNIRLYNIKDFIKLFKCKFSTGTLDTKYVALVYCH